MKSRECTRMNAIQAKTRSGVHWCLCAALLFSAILFSAMPFPARAADAPILPVRLADFDQKSTRPYTPSASERAIYNEYEFDAGETAQYAAGSRKLEITAIRAKDPTGAIGLYEWLKPADAKPANVGERGAAAGDATYFQYGNYVLIMRGSKPDDEPFEAMLSILPRFEHGAAPPLLKQMPAEGMVPNSERYVLGPAALAKFAPEIPPSTAGFHLGSEAQIADYTSGGVKLKLALFSYPTPQMARAQADEFNKLPNVMAKRSSMLIGVVINPASRDEAENLLAKVRYDGAVTFDQKMPTRRDNIGDLVLNILLLCGIIIVFAVMAGLMMGGGRALLSKILPGRVADSTEERQIIRLHLGDE